MHLERALGSEVRIKVLRTLLQDALPKLDAVALSKETGKSVSGIHKALTELLDSRLLTASVTGRATHYGVDSTHPLFEELLELFRRERTKDNVPHLFPTYWNHLESVVSMLASFPSVEAVVLFGSFTRPPIYPTADVDLLVVGPRPWVANQKVLAHDVSLVAMKEDELAAKTRAGDDFTKSILERHVVLYEAADYELPWRRNAARLPQDLPRRRGGRRR